VVTGIPRSTGPSLLTVRGLTRRFGPLIALSDVAFEVREGEALGLIGPNGAGKTTLLECLSGLQPVNGGQVSWRGATVPAHRRRELLFFVPEGILPYPEHGTARVLGFFAEVYRRSRAEIGDAVEALGLGPVLAKTVAGLSKGYRRRLLLALGLLSPHPLLLLDEPFDGLDLRQTREVMALLRRVAAGGRTLLLSIHQLADAERVCDRLILLSGGTVRGEGTLEELRARARVAGSLEDVFLALA
jgi:ABC-2 type transport system ATP-binding protein